MPSSRFQPSGNSYTSTANTEDYRLTLFVVRWLVGSAADLPKLRFHPSLLK